MVVGWSVVAGVGGLVLGVGWSGVLILVPWVAVEVLGDGCGDGSWFGGGVVPFGRRFVTVRTGVREWTR